MIYLLGLKLWNDEIRIVFIGKIGLGKSVIGNIIFGEKLLIFGLLGKFVIIKCLQLFVVCFDYKIFIVDIFGIFDIL